MHRLVLDLRLALRSLARRPGYTLIALITLALGIGATTALYTVVQSVLLEPLPYPEPDRIVVVREKNPEAGLPVFSMSPPNFRDYREQATSFDAFGASTGASLAFEPADGSQAVRWVGRRATFEYLSAYGTPPLLGRTFVEEDDRPGAEPVVVLSYDAWQDLGGTPDVLGTRIRLNGRATEVIGVMPSGYREQLDAYVPLAVDYEEAGRGAHWITGVGRLREGVTPEAALSELNTIAAALEEEYPDSNTGWSAHVAPLHELIVSDTSSALWILLAATGVVLLLACANVAHLTLTRLAEREREIALRSALGAGRWQVVRQLLVEGGVLALVGGGLGLVVARFATAALVDLHSDAIPRAESIGIDGGVLLFALLVSAASVLMFGLVPALRAANPNLASTLKEGGRGFAEGLGGGRLRRGLVLFQVASAVVLAVGAGLLTRSLRELSAVDPGFTTEGVWTARLALPDSRYEDEEQQQEFFRRLHDELEGLPGVESAASVMPMPLSGGGYVLQFFIEGRPLPELNKELGSDIAFVMPDYFETLEIPIQVGRGFEITDDASSSAAVVISRAAADRFWPDGDPVGQRITFGDPRDEDEDDWMMVVGVSGNVLKDELSAPSEPMIYVPVLQTPQSFATLVVRAGGDASSVAAGVREVVRRIDPALPLFGEQPAEAYLRDSLAGSRFVAALLGSFAGLAILLAVVGVFGVVSYGVRRGLREIGVRIALGAGTTRIARHVVGRGVRPVVLGVVLGLGLALAASRLLESLVYGVGTADPATYALVAGGLVLAGVVACGIPAMRAMRVDPVVVLRDE